MKMDRIIFGDNQFFGINHMSEEKANSQLVRFHDIGNIIGVLDAAYKVGIRGFMFSTHERVAEICAYLRSHPESYRDIRLYPVLPYAHKYANAVAEKGIVGAMKDVLITGSGPSDILRTLVTGGKGAITQDPFEMMKALVDVELKMFRGMDLGVVFLQNIVSDLILGLRIGEACTQLATYVRKQYHTEVGFMTMNLPAMVTFLKDAGISNPIVCSSVNKIGYLMNPSKKSYEDAIAKGGFRPVAMSVLASGAIPPREAFEYICNQRNIESIVFGASSPSRIEVSTRHIEELDSSWRTNSDLTKTEVDPESGSLPPVDRVCGIPFARSTKTQILDEIARNIQGPRHRRTICVTNTESMYFALRTPEHAEYIRQSRYSLCDGVGVVLGGLVAGKRLSRFNGPALLEHCCAHGLRSGWRHFFYGGTPGLAERLSSRLRERFPGMIVAGTYTPPFRSIGTAEEGSVLTYIESTRPDILWVGLGMPKQERWIADHLEKLNIPWCIGVGAAFDFLGGTANWAPRWIRNIGLEWLYRLFHEPRMLPRVARSFVFLGQAVARALPHTVRETESTTN